MEYSSVNLHEDISLGILLDLHAQEEGDALWKAFKASGETMPKKLDQRCRRALESQKKTWLIRAAVWFLGFFLFGTLSFFAAEAGGLIEIRVPLWKGYFVTQQKESVTVHFAPTDPIRRQDPEKVRQALESAMPQSFFCTVAFLRSYPPDNPGYYTQYINGGTGEIYLHCQDPGRGLVEVEAKNATVEDIRYLDRDMALLTFESGWTVVWHNQEENLCYILSAQDIREWEFWALVNALLGI